MGGEREDLSRAGGRCGSGSSTTAGWSASASPTRTGRRPPREVEEETGWRLLALEPVLTFQPLLGSVDSLNDLFVAHGAERTA